MYFVVKCVYLYTNWTTLKKPPKDSYLPLLFPLAFGPLAGSSENINCTIQLCIAVVRS